MLDRFPDDAFIDPEIIMDRDVSHPGNLPPRNIGMPTPEGGINGLNRLTNNHEVVNHPDLTQRIAQKGLGAFCLLCLDFPDGVENLLQPFRHRSHNRTAS